MIKPNPLGEVPTDTNLGDTDYNHFKRDQYGVGWDFNHQFNDTWRFEQNLKYFSSEVKILQVYGAGLVDADGDHVPDDYRTVNRYNFPFNEDTKSFNVDNRVEGKINGDTVKQRLLFGLDYRRYTNDSEFGFSGAPTIDLFNPVYGVPITTPTTLFPYVQEVQKQTGLYAEDSIKIDRWVVTLGGRYDHVDQSNSGADETDDKFSCSRRRTELPVRQRRCAVRVVCDLVPACARRGLQRQCIQAVGRQPGRSGPEVAADRTATGRARPVHGGGL